MSQGAFTEFDFPGATLTRPLGINDAGEIVGLYRDSKQGKDHGFLLSGGTFTSIDFPGASQTHAIGIDSVGTIFGSYCIGGNSCYPVDELHGFVLSGGVFTAIDFPGAVSTEGWGQDRAGQIAGRYQDPNGVFHIFLLSNGSFASIDFPGAAETAPSFYGADGGFNAGGDIASGYCSAEPCANPSPGVHSFLLKDGQFVSFDPLGARQLCPRHELHRRNRRSIRRSGRTLQRLSAGSLTGPPRIRDGALFAGDSHGRYSAESQTV